MIRMYRLLFATFFETMKHRARRGSARPTWTFRFEWLVAYLRRDFETSASWSLPRLRADLDRRAYPRDFVRRVIRSESTLGGVAGEWFVPLGAPEGRAVLFLHGGGYVFGSTRTHADIIARLAIAAHVRVFAPNYRLAPEHVYPAQRDDALAAFEAMSKAMPAARIVVAGDSAGGNLALALQITRRDRGLPQAAATVLISPWLDLTASHASTRTNDAIDYGTRELVLGYARVFAGGIPLADPRLSPLGARLDGLAPIFIAVGDAERLHDEAVAFADKAHAAGVDATLDVLRDMPHNGPVLAGFHPEAARGIGALAAFMVRHLSNEELA